VVIAMKAATRLSKSRLDIGVRGRLPLTPWRCGRPVAAGLAALLLVGCSPSVVLPASDPYSPGYVEREKSGYTLKTVCEGGTPIYSVEVRDATSATYYDDMTVVWSARAVDPVKELATEIPLFVSVVPGYTVSVAEPRWPGIGEFSIGYAGAESDGVGGSVIVRPGALAVGEVEWQGIAGGRIADASSEVRGLVHSRA
jgi:hypothetical protein